MQRTAILGSEASTAKRQSNEVLHGDPRRAGRATHSAMAGIFPLHQSGPAGENYISQMRAAVNGACIPEIFWLEYQL